MITTTDVRIELGSPSADIVDDKTILHAIKLESTLFGAAARTARIMSRKFALKADRSLGDVKLSHQKHSERWSELAEELEKKTMLGALPFCGGITKNSKNIEEADSGRTEPYFSRDMIDEGDYA